MKTCKKCRGKRGKASKKNSRIAGFDLQGGVVPALTQVAAAVAGRFIAGAVQTKVAPDKPAMVAAGITALGVVAATSDNEHISMLGVGMAATGLVNLAKSSLPADSPVAQFIAGVDSDIIAGYDEYDDDYVSGYDEEDYKSAGIGGSEFDTNITA